MNQEIRDAIATEEFGYNICPFVLGGYVHCERDCERCEENPYRGGNDDEKSGNTNDGSTGANADHAVDVVTDQV